VPSIMAQGYAITPAGARKLIPFTDPPYDIFDFILRQLWLTKLKLIEVYPHPVQHHDGESMIDRIEPYGLRRTALGRLRRTIFKARRSIWLRYQI